MAMTDTEAKERFWLSVDKRAMEMPYCTACRTWFYYPRPFCPSCWSTDVEFRPVSGNGTVWTYSVVRFAHGIPSPWHERIPYVVALVTLDEGVRMMSNIIECDVDTIRSGLPVRLTYTEIGGRTLPAFVPAVPA
jgi:uncharacterized OB-fold protein